MSSSLHETNVSGTGSSTTQRVTQSLESQKKSVSNKSDSPKVLNPKVRFQVIKEFLENGGAMQGVALSVIIRFVETGGSIDALSSTDKDAINRYLNWGHQKSGTITVIEACSQRAVRGLELMDTISTFFPIEQYNKVCKLINSIVHDSVAVNDLVNGHRS